MELLMSLWPIVHSFVVPKQGTHHLWLTVYMLVYIFNGARSDWWKSDGAGCIVGGWRQLRCNMASWLTVCLYAWQPPRINTVSCTMRTNGQNLPNSTDCILPDGATRLEIPNVNTSLFSPQMTSQRCDTRSDRGRGVRQQQSSFTSPTQPCPRLGNQWRDGGRGL